MCQSEGVAVDYVRTRLALERLRHLASDPKTLTAIVAATNERLRTELPSLRKQQHHLEKELGDVKNQAEVLINCSASQGGLLSGGSPVCNKGRTFRAAFTFPKPEGRPRPRRMYRNPVLLAREWQKSLEVGIYASKADLARCKGISRARVTQILNLLRLSPDVLRTVIELGDPLPPGIITERWLRPLVGQPDDGQVDMLKVILARRRGLRF